MEEKIGSVHFFQERKAGEGKIIKILVSEEGNILSSENQKAKFIEAKGGLYYSSC